MPIELKLGKRLGSGANKYAYTLPDDPTKVALISGCKTLNAEIADLKALEDLGVPVPKVYELYKEVKTDKTIGERESALIMERFVCASRGDIVTHLMDVLNNNTLNSIELIRSKLYTAQRYVVDLQFLFREDGSMVVADPDGVFTPETVGQWNQYKNIMEHEFKRIEDGVTYVKDFKSGLAPAPADVDTYSFWAVSRMWNANLVEPKAALQAATQGIYTKTFDLVALLDDEWLKDVAA